MVPIEIEMGCWQCIGIGGWAAGGLSVRAAAVRGCGRGGAQGGSVTARWSNRPQPSPELTDKL